MISSWNDYVDYIRADDVANGFDQSRFSRFNMIRKYLHCLRKLEYISNCKSSAFLLNYYKCKLYRLSLKTGITIGINCFGKGLYIPHHGYIVVNSSAHFGNDCVIQCGVNISENVKGGNHIYLSSGAKLLSNISIADDTIVGANAVVTKSFDEPNIVIAGVPAIIISFDGFKNRKNI